MIHPSMLRSADAAQMSISSPDYCYEPEFDSRKQIRLLSFATGAGSEPLVLELTAFDLSSPPPFTALSYMWGGRSGRKYITINGQSIQVRRNCYYALRQLQSAAALSIYYWIDAISIDQSNTRERGHQVQMMAYIFACAEQVVVSYGTDTPESKAFTRMVQDLSAGLSRQGDDQIRKNGELTAQELAGLLDLTQRSYWHRMWIVQELAMAKSVVILVRDFPVPLQCIFRFIHTLKLDSWSWPSSIDSHVRAGHIVDAAACDDPFSELAISIDNLPMMALGYGLNWQATGAHSSGAPFSQLSFQQALDNFGDKRCGDVRDRIYAIMSLVDWPTDREPIKVSYEIRPLGLVQRLCLYYDRSSCTLWAPRQYASLLCASLGIVVEDDDVATMLKARRDRYAREVLRQMASSQGRKQNALPLHPPCSEKALGVLDLSQQIFCLRQRDGAGLSFHHTGLRHSQMLNDNQAESLGSQVTDQSSFSGQILLDPPEESKTPDPTAWQPLAYHSGTGEGRGKICSAAQAGDLLALLSGTTSKKGTMCLVLRREPSPERFCLVGFAVVDIDRTLYEAKKLHTQRDYLLLHLHQRDLISMACLFNSLRDEEAFSTADTHRNHILRTSPCQSQLSSYGVLGSWSGDAFVPRTGWYSHL